MLTVATMLWEQNGHSRGFSRDYDEAWVDKLYRSFARHLTTPFRFACFTDQRRMFAEPIEQEPILSAEPDYGCFIEPFRLGEPMILVGLDTIVTGNIDHLAAYCMTADAVALPRDPYNRAQACNGVALVPAGHEDIYSRWNGENDMEWLRQQPHDDMDVLFPGAAVSFKVHVAEHGLGDARIVYFHGVPKAPKLGHLEWVQTNWG